MPEDTAREPTARSLIGSIALTRIKAKAVADNSVVKQKSEGEVAEQSAATALQVARNVAGRQKAEAEKAEADAKKVTAEAITARATAQNAQAKARADAQTIKAEAELRKQKYIVTLETARNAARSQQAEADKIEATVATKKQANAIIKRQLDLTDCSKPYRGTGNTINDFADIYMRRNACGNN